MRFILETSLVNELFIPKVFVVVVSWFFFLGGGRLLIKVLIFNSNCSLLAHRKTIFVLCIFTLKLSLNLVIYLGAF